MVFQTFFSLVVAAAAVVEAVKIPQRIKGESLIGRREYNQLLRRQHGHEAIKMPEWNYANGTTKDATIDGKVGVILEPDLIVGSKGKDGAMITKCKFFFDNVLILHAS
jgi:hypothetical protein